MFLLDMDMNNDNTTQLLLTGAPHLLHPDLISCLCDDQDSCISICFVSPIKNWFLSHSCDNIYRLTLDICPVGDPHLLEVSAIPLACHTLHYMRGQWLLASVWNIKCRSQLFCGFSDQKCVQQIEHWFIQIVIKHIKLFYSSRRYEILHC